MIGAFWNIRSLNKTGKLECLRDFINTHKLDFIGIQETKKKKAFTTLFLLLLEFLLSGIFSLPVVLLVVSW